MNNDSSDSKIVVLEETLDSPQTQNWWENTTKDTDWWSFGLNKIQTTETPQMPQKEFDPFAALLETTQSVLSPAPVIIPDPVSVPVPTSKTVPTVESSQTQSIPKSDVVIQGFTELIGLMFNADNDSSSSTFEERLLSKAETLCCSLVPETQRKDIGTIFKAISNLMIPAQTQIPTQVQTCPTVQKPQNDYVVDFDEDNDECSCSCSCDWCCEENVSSNSSNTSSTSSFSYVYDDESFIDANPDGVSEDRKTSNDNMNEVDEIVTAQSDASDNLWVTHPSHNFRLGEQVSGPGGFLYTVTGLTADTYTLRSANPLDPGCLFKLPIDAFQRYYPSEIVSGIGRDVLDLLQKPWYYYANQFLIYGAEQNLPELCMYLLDFPMNYIGNLKGNEGLTLVAPNPLCPNGTQKTAFEFAVVNGMFSVVEKMLLGMKSLENKDSILALVGTGDCSDCDRTRTISVLLRWRGMNGEHIQLTNLECARGILEEPAFWVNGALTLDFVETLPAEMKDIALRFLFSARFAKSRLFC